MAFVNNRWILVGLTSGGVGCALPNYVAVYTRVSSFISFINSNANITVAETISPNNTVSQTTVVPVTTQRNYTESTTKRNEGRVINKSVLIFAFWFSCLILFFSDY